MTSDFDLADPAALAAVQLRRRLRALAAGQTEAFDLLYYQFGAESSLGATIGHAANRLPYLAVLWPTLPGPMANMRRTRARCHHLRRKPKRSSACSATTPTSDAERS